MLRSENTATPSTAFTVTVPDSLPGRSIPALRPMVIVTGPLNVVAWLPCASSTVTFTGRMVAKGSVVLGWTVNARCSDGLSASTLLNQVVGVFRSNAQVHDRSIVGVRVGKVLHVGGDIRGHRDSAGGHVLDQRVGVSDHRRGGVVGVGEVVEDFRDRVRRAGPKERRNDRVPAVRVGGVEPLA